MHVNIVYAILYALPESVEHFISRDLRVMHRDFHVKS